MELNAEQIKKALECCVEVRCGSIAICPYREKFKNCYICQANLKKEVLSLIEELTEENERLINAGFDTVDYAIDRIREVKADTVRKYYSEVYEELLKVAACQIADEPNMRSQEVFAILEQKAKEMLEGTNEC